MDDSITNDLPTATSDEDLGPRSGGSGRFETEPKVDAVDSAKLQAWLDGLSYDPEQRGLRFPPTEFEQATSVLGMMTRLHPSCGQQSDVVSCLLEMLRQLIKIAEENHHPFQKPIQKLIDYYEMVSRDCLSGGLVALGSESFDLLPPLESIQFVRNCLFELFEHARAILASNGFFDTTPGGIKKVIVVNGRYRTGSTLAMNAVAATLRAAGESTRINSGDFNQIDTLVDCFALGAYQGHYLILKSHNWMPRRPREGVLTLYTKRNLADVAASAVRLWRRNGTPEEIADENYAAAAEEHIVNELFYQKLMNDYLVDAKSVVKIDYDVFYNDQEGLIKYLASLLEVQLKPSEVRAAATMIEPARVKRLADAMTTEVDERTLLRRYHISETLGAKYAGLHVLSPRLKSVLRTLGEWPFEEEG